MGDPHQGVVDRVHQRVQGLPVAPDDHVVRHVLLREADRPRTRSSHPSPVPASGSAAPAPGPPRGRRPLLGGQVPAVAVVTRRRSSARARRSLRPPRWSRTTRTQTASGEPPGHVGVHLQPLGLPVRRVRTPHLRALVPAQAQPPQRLEQRQVAVLGVPRGVGVLDPEHEGAPGMPGIGPVEQRGAHHAHVGVPGRRRAEPHAHGVGHGGRG